ncbi:hypothetical protein GCM10011573_31260 [Enterococcus wangshanyuanii]|uniref:Uncharacterized protein n=1 Tax=Enterococcus wangshanyuanii TaxID=2005703 RepID=A0ABQ1PM71_9ENTE|nr:hypothetical protein GCM10011573_31260 [Enterococcus wangshanyuanii]
MSQGEQQKRRNDQNRITIQVLKKLEKSGRKLLTNNKQSDKLMKLSLKQTTTPSRKNFETF